MDDFKKPKPIINANPKSASTDEPEFVPPEIVAKKEDAALPAQHVEIPLKPAKKHRRLSLKALLPKTKKQKIIFVITFVLICGLGYWFGIRPLSNRSVSEGPSKKTVYTPPKPTTEASRMTGVQVDPSVNKRAVTAVMIENSPESRPQSGLKDADIVFEAVAEGGITRFVALFHDSQPDYIGPIRSVRPYYLDWFMPFDAAIAHVGGSPKALSDIKTLKAKDLDQFANSGAYTRVKNRFAPHNVYSSVAKLNELMNNKGFTTSSFTSFSRKKESKLTTPTAKTVNLNISSYYYNVKYDYDSTSNTYLRSEGGAVHKDEKSGAQLAPKVVVAIVMSRGIDSDGQHTAYTTTGSGKVYVFQDGGVTDGTWSKSSRTAQWQFTDAAGKTLSFNPGQTWFSMVDSGTSVTYTP